MIDPRKVKPGEVVKESIFRQLLEYLASLEIVTEEGSGLESRRTEAGTSIEIVQRPEFPIRITASSAGKYAWTAVRGTAGGGWEDLPGPVGTIARDWAVEENGQAASLPQVVWARREESTNQLVFSRDTCT